MQNTKLCIVNSTQFYLEKRNCKIDNENKSLIITYEKPYKNTSANSFSRWVKEELTNAGIDTNIYKAYNCRAASKDKT